MIQQPARLWQPFALGVVAALGQAPFDLPALMLAGIALALWLSRRAQSPARAAAFGWAFGFGYFVLALHWIVSPFLVDVARHGWMAPFALLLLSGGIALFWMLAFWMARMLGRGTGWICVTLPATEMLRAYVFTGFPWASPAQALVDTGAGQALGVIGPYAATGLIMSAAMLLARPPRILSWGAGLLIGAACVLPASLPDAPLTGAVLRLVQPNAPQHQKWDPLMIPVFYDRQLAFTAAPPTEGLPAPAAILWPETAIPWRLDRADSILREISATAAGTPVILGVQRSEENRHYNALVALTATGEIAQIYDKQHLVPFGEYIPFGNALAGLGIHGLAAQEGAGFSAGTGARLIDLGPLGQALPLICYEAVFAHDVNAAPARPDLILHITNDAWFGTYAGPQQHLAQARMRAIEQGLPVARAANTGISAMIDPRGRITHSLGLGEAGFIDAPLPAPGAPTLYSRTGDLPLMVLMVLALLSGAVHSRKKLGK